MGINNAMLQVCLVEFFNGMNSAQLPKQGKKGRKYMRNNNHIFFWSIVLMVATSSVLFSHRVSANDGPPAYIYELFARQVEQDVILTSALACPNGCDSEMTRVNYSTNHEKQLGDIQAGEENGFVKTDICSSWGDEPEWIQISELCSKHKEVCVDCDGNGSKECYPDCESCKNNEEDYVGRQDCEGLPFFCHDCDEDGVPECPGFCPVARYYEVVDHCVIPGDYTYKARATSAGGGVTKQVKISVVDNNFSDCFAHVDTSEKAENECDGGEHDGGEHDGGEHDGGEHDGGEHDGGEHDGGDEIEDDDETNGCQFVATSRSSHLVGVFLLILEHIL
jgi:hypothetical protein